MPDHLPIRFRLDGVAVEVAIDPLTPVGTVLTDTLGPRAVVEPCGVGACGACTILLDGTSALGCLTPVGLIDGRSVTTIEGVAEDDPVVNAFVDATAFQCAYCTPGFVLATLALQAEGSALDRDEIVRGLAGNLCRCSSYVAIIEAATAATSQ